MAEMTSFVKEMAALARDERQLLEAKMESQHEAVRQEVQSQVAAVEARLTPLPALSEAALAALQARLERLQTAQLLTDDELHTLQDCVADFVELQLSMLPERPKSMV